MLKSLVFEPQSTHPMKRGCQEKKILPAPAEDAGVVACIQPHLIPTVRRSPRESHTLHEVLIARIRMQVIEHGPNLRENQIVFTALIALLQPEEGFVLISEIGVNDCQPPRRNVGSLG